MAAQPRKKRFSHTRRKFLIAGALLGGGLVVGAHYATRLDRMGKPSLMNPGEGEFAFNGWIKIDANGTLTVAVPRVEMGQGVHTALAQLVAEEMDADWTKITVVQAPLDSSYVNLVAAYDDQGSLLSGSNYFARHFRHAYAMQLTAASSSVRDAWRSMREAGALARSMLVHAAAHYWDVNVEEVEARQGTCVHTDSRRQLSFAQIAPYAAYFPIKEAPRVKDPTGFNLLGQSLARVDIPAKVNGKALFGADLNLPGMLHAGLKTPAQVGSHVKRYEASAVIGIPGVRAVVSLGDSVAVVADTRYRVENAIDALPVEFASDTSKPYSQTDIDAALDDALDHAGSSVEEDTGDVGAGLKQVLTTVDARYRVPFLAHANMEPMNCTALVSDGRCEIWGATQAPDLARRTAARTLGLAERAVTVHTLYAGGGNGRLLEMDAVSKAVTIAARIKDTPIKLIYDRSADFRLDYHRPAAACSLSAGLDAAGNLTVWKQKIASVPVADAYAGRWLNWGEARLFHRSDTEGATHNAYLVPNRRIEYAPCKLPVSVGYWRSHAHSYTAFFRECFIDELANAAHIDPVRFRLRLLAGRPRHQAVLDLAAEKIRWESGRSPGTGLGIALHESYGSIAAQAIEVEVAADGSIRLKRVVCAVDCGLAVNPDGVKAQAESGIIHGLSAALFGGITLEKGEMQQRDFSDYPILTMAQTPDIETYIVPSAASPGGMGGVAVPPAAPALVNAIYAATRQRIRTLPLSSQGFALA